jgi:hypothetical protein
MSNARISTLATQFAVTGNQAAMATAIGGGIVASDLQALAALMNLLALSPDVSMPLLGQAVTPPGLGGTYAAPAATMLQPS